MTTPTQKALAKLFTKEEKQPGNFFLGSFPVKRGEDLMVCDPCYQDGDKQVHKIKPGKWLAYTRVSDDTGGWGKRNASLTVIHESETYPSCEGINFYLGQIGVDSGQAGIYAMKGWEEFNPSEDDYDKVCGTTSEGIGAGMVDYGVTSSSGYGDGGYELFSKTDLKGKIVALEVVFIPEEGDPRIAELEKDREAFDNGSTEEE